MNTAFRRSSPPSSRGSFGTSAPRRSSGSDEGLVDLVNQWWRNDTLDRGVAAQLADEMGLTLVWCSIRDIENSLQAISWSGPYRFVQSDRDGGWLWTPAAVSNEWFALPADPSYFQTPGILSLLERMFDGVPTSLAKRPPLRRACRFRRSDTELEHYSIVARGSFADAGETPPSASAAPRLTAHSSSYGRVGSVATGPAQQPPPKEIPIQRPPAFPPVARLNSDPYENLSPGGTGSTPPSPTAGLPAALLMRRLDSMQRQLTEHCLRISLLESSGRAVPKGGAAVASSRASEGTDLPEGWRAVLAQPEPAATPGDDVSASPTAYLRRIVRLNEILRDFLNRAQSPLEARIIHLALESDHVQLHDVDIQTENGIVKVNCLGCQGPLADLMMFQLFVAARSEKGNSHLLLPPGPFNPTNFPHAYRLLLDTVPGNLTSVASIAETCRLTPLNSASSGYAVAGKMRVEYRLF